MQIDFFSLVVQVYLQQSELANARRIEFVCYLVA